jgi:hypothetical protein
VELVDDGAGDRGGEHRVASGDDADDRDQRLGGCILEQEAPAG